VHTERRRRRSQDGLALTIVYTLLYTFLFVFVYVQLWLILHHGHKRFSYQSVLLFLCLLWAALRTTLFSFYFENVSQANRLQPFPYWLLYCCPVCLQFFTLCLLNLYFTQVRITPNLTRLCVCVYVYAWVRVCVRVCVCLCVCVCVSPSAGGVRRAVLARVLVNDSLFVLCAVSLSVCIFRIAKMSSANVYLESKATAIGSLIILLFTSRACYNLAVVVLAPEGPATPFSYGWFSVSDQADVQQVSGETYVVFGVVLLLWELLPTSLLVGFFRVQQPNLNLVSGMINSQSFSSRAYLFDNPRRYDSEDDLTRSITSRSDRARWDAHSDTRTHTHTHAGTCTRPTHTDTHTHGP
uniref:G protein-coupled receptor 137c n=1 Tax=Gadus morhua TaxID=8049 RepID=A0A8C5FRE3_GADMO